MADDIDAVVAEWRRVRPDLDLAPMEVFARLTRVGGRIDRRFAEHGVDRREFDVLAALRRQGPPYELTPSRLSRSVLAASGTMTGRLDRLARRGLIERLPNPADRRGVIVRLTASGAQRAARIRVARLLEEARQLGALDEVDRRALAALLRRLLLAVEHDR